MNDHGVWRELRQGQHEMTLEELEAALRQSEELKLRIVRDTGMFTVALFAVFGIAEQERLAFAGTGTLVSFKDSHYILTAAHVWEESISNSRGLGLTLRENVNHKYFMDIRTLVPVIVPHPPWGEWGPDIALVRIPEANVGTIKAFRVFYALDAEPVLPRDVKFLQARMLMGTPAEFGEFTQVYAGLQINGFFVSVEGERMLRGAFDYIDFEFNTDAAGIPSDFGGVSGGGLWEVYIYHDRNENRVDSVAKLTGLAFWQFALEEGTRRVRCHGFDAIHVALGDCA